jgi:choline dehydrogenase-like flavoprotein
MPSPTALFDYVIVGSGAGGGPLATNLAKAGYDVVLIEAGDPTGTSLSRFTHHWDNRRRVRHLNAAERLKSVPLVQRSVSHACRL